MFALPGSRQRKRLRRNVISNELLSAWHHGVELTEHLSCPTSQVTYRLRLKRVLGEYGLYEPSLSLGVSNVPILVE